MSTGDEALPDRDALPFSKQEIAEFDARFAELESGAIESISRTEAQRQLLEHLDRQIRVRQVEPGARAPGYIMPPRLGLSAEPNAGA